MLLHNHREIDLLWFCKRSTEVKYNSYQLTAPFFAIYICYCLYENIWSSEYYQWKGMIQLGSALKFITKFHKWSSKTAVFKSPRLSIKNIRQKFPYLSSRLVQIQPLMICLILGSVTFSKLAGGTPCGNRREEFWSFFLVLLLPYYTGDHTKTMYMDCLIGFHSG